MATTQLPIEGVFDRETGALVGFAADSGGEVALDVGAVQAGSEAQVWVTDPRFGGVSGASDNLAAFQAAINSFQASADCLIYVPDGSWVLSATPTIGARRVTWILSAGAVVSGAGSLPDSVIQLKRGISSPKFNSGAGTLNINATGASSAQTRFISGQMYVYGTNTDADTVAGKAHNLLSITGDNVALSGGGMIDGFSIIHAVGGGATSGTRNAVHSRIAVVGGVTAAPLNDMVSSLADGYSQANQGGTGGAFVSSPDEVYKGSLWGGNDNVWLASGATHYRGVYGREINVSINAGASAYAKAGLFIAKLPSDTAQAFADDCAVLVGGKSGVIAWKKGICFGATWGDWVFNSSSTLIGVQPRTVPSAGPTPVAAAGVDFYGVNFSNHAFRSNGFGVLPSGATYSTPESTATPVVNGEMRFELTSNTSLKIKVKGSDGVVRSATLTLA